MKLHEATMRYMKLFWSYKELNEAIWSYKELHEATLSYVEKLLANREL